MHRYRQILRVTDTLLDKWYRYKTLDKTTICHDIYKKNLPVFRNIIQRLHVEINKSMDINNDKK